MNNVPFSIPPDFLWEDPSGIRGCNDGIPFCLSRRGTNSTVLLHELDQSICSDIHDIVSSTPIPNFRRPFKTGFLGTFQLSNRTFLLEPLPCSVPLIDAWKEVLKSNPDHAVNMIRQLIIQLEQLLRELVCQGEEYGAACASNVVLTTRGVYGLLEARLKTNEGDLWLRDIKTSEGNSCHTSDNRSETINLIIQELLEIEASSGALPIYDRHQLYHLCEPYITIEFQTTQQNVDKRKTCMMESFRSPEASRT